jgi:hypothetical protein
MDSSSKTKHTASTGQTVEGGKANESALLAAAPNAFWSSDAASNPDKCAEAFPVFVLGAARSGTTVMAMALRKATRYRGFPEGHVLDVAARLIEAIDAQWDKKNSSIGPKAISVFQLGQLSRARYRMEMIEVLRRLASGYTTPYWYDKTPTHQMVASVPLLAEAWPNARFLFMKRRGLENLCSWQRKFRRDDFSIGCRNWALAMSIWRTVRDSVPNRFIELDQRTLQEDPEGSAACVGGLLSLSAHEIEVFTAVLRRERPQMTDPSATIFNDVSELGWAPERIEMFRDLCDGEMEAYGYTYDSRYCR